MGQRAVEMGVDILTGTPASNILYNEKGYVRGIVTQDFGISKKGEGKDKFVPGLEIIGKQTVFA
jgi:electron-transferring-flavoprotein dehydrogenase